MSEPTLCPYRKTNISETFEKLLGNRIQAIMGPRTDEFGPCLEEKCAMWREKDSRSVVFDALIGAGADQTLLSKFSANITVGHCGLAGRP